MTRRGRKGRPHATRSPLGLRLLLPVSCLGCDQESDWICDTCRKNLEQPRPNQCVACGKAGRDGLCARCRTNLKVDGVTCMLAYRDPAVRRLIYAVKFGGAIDGLTFFATVYGSRLLRHLPDADWCVCPIPLSRERVRERGFNQALVLSEQLGWPFEIRELLVRQRHTRPQAELDGQDRARNVRGAFRVTDRVPPLVLLVDDVITTGATLRAAAGCLRRAGAKTIWAVTIAHG